MPPRLHHRAAPADRPALARLRGERVMSGRWERRYERKAARRYSHMTPWRPCRVGFCLRCKWRTITGANRRALAAHLVRSRELMATFPAQRMRRDADGHWVRVPTEGDER